jgi:hypothetical protein
MSMASAWADYDIDGDLDLYVGDYGWVDETQGMSQDQMGPGERDFVYQNQGDGTFIDISDAFPREFHDGYAYAGGWVDLDADGDLDLYTVNDFGANWPNRVLWNDGAGGLVLDLDDPSQLDLSMTGMGLGIGDINGDGHPDIAIAEWAKNKLLESRPDGGYWVDVADATGFRIDLSRGQQVGWGTLLGDVDNDGDLDILNQYGHLQNDNTERWSNRLKQPDGLYLNSGGEPYTLVDVGEAWGVADLGSSRGAVLADINGDGWLDIAKRSLDEDSVLYLSRCGTAAWTIVALQQPGTMNTAAVGARVEITAAGRTQTGWIIAGGVGYASAPPLEAHFGLGEGVDVIDEIRVVWPDGAHSVVRDVDARQRVVVTRLGI